MADTVQNVRSLAQSWDRERTGLAAKGDTDSLNKFVDRLDGISRELASLFGDMSAPEWIALQELAGNIASRLMQAKTFVNGQERKNM